MTLDELFALELTGEERVKYTQDVLGIIEERERLFEEFLKTQVIDEKFLNFTYTI